MKLLDGNGKFLGLINVIDLAVVIILLFITMPLGIFSFKMLSRKPVVEDKLTFASNFDVVFSAVDKKLVLSIKQGDKGIDVNGKFVSEVLWVGEPKVTEYSIILGDKFDVKVPDNRYCDIPAKVMLEGYVKNNNFYYNDWLINEAGFFKINFNGYSVFARIQRQPFESFPLQLKIRFENLIPELVELMKSNYEEKVDGRVIGRDLKVLNLHASELSERRMRGKITSEQLSRMKFDVDVSVQVVAERRYGLLYFRDYNLKVGNEVILSSELYSIKGIIIGMDNK